MIIQHILSKDDVEIYIFEITCPQQLFLYNMINTYKVTFCTSLILFFLMSNFSRYAFSMKSREINVFNQKNRQKNQRSFFIHFFFISKISQKKRSHIKFVLQNLYQVVDFIFFLRREETISFFIKKNSCKIQSQDVNFRDQIFKCPSDIREKAFYIYKNSSEYNVKKHLTLQSTPKSALHKT